MLPEFEQNAAFIWTIFAIGLIVPALLGLYAGLLSGLSEQGQQIVHRVRRRFPFRLGQSRVG